MVDNYYNKPDQRRNNATFLKRVFPNGLTGSYVELIGGHDPQDKMGKDQMFGIMKKAKLIRDDLSFIGVDEDPVVLLHRMKDKPKLHPYPVVFGDVFYVIRKIQQKRLQDINGNAIEANHKVIAVNFDVGKAALDHGWWEKNQDRISEIVKAAFEYSSKIVFIGNFSKGRGVYKLDNPDVEERNKIRKGQLIDSIMKAFRISERGLTNSKDWPVNSLEEYKCHENMVYVRFVLENKFGNVSISFFNKEGLSK